MGVGVGWEKSHTGATRRPRLGLVAVNGAGSDGAGQARHLRRGGSGGQRQSDSAEKRRAGPPCVRPGRRAIDPTAQQRGPALSRARNRGAPALRAGSGSGRDGGRQFIGMK